MKVKLIPTVDDSLGTIHRIPKMEFEEKEISERIEIIPTTARILRGVLDT